MKELVEYIARAIASHPDDVQVTEETEDDQIVLHLTVHDDDKGKIIGRQGRVAQAIRVLLRVTGVKNDVRVTLKIE
ncbi:MAG: KH domain-containing protein [Dehalococcoidia bacterium]|nr:KH domain-containing protein [Dehalococcoidia bacterium]